MRDFPNKASYKFIYELEKNKIKTFQLFKKTTAPLSFWIFLSKLIAVKKKHQFSVFFLLYFLNYIF